VIETEEMVVETSTFSFADYLDVRVSTCCSRSSATRATSEEAFAFAAEHGISAFDLVVKVQQLLPRAPAGFRKVIDDFVRESQEELFPSREAVVAWARERLPALISGEAGRKPAEQVLDAGALLRDP